MTPHAATGAVLQGRWEAGRLALVPPTAASEPPAVVAVAGRLTSPEPLTDRLLAGLAPENGLLASTSGEFAAVLWNEDAREGWIVRDHLGAADVFYTRTSAGALVFADEIVHLLSLLAATPGPDVDALTCWLGTGTLPIGATFYAGVARLAPGHALRLDGTSRPRRWWRLEAGRRVLPASRAELGAAVLEVAAGAVDRAADDDAGVLVSGGLDSSTVLTLLTERQRARRGPLPVAYSAVFPGHEETDESQLIEILTRHLGLEAVRSTIEGGSALRGALDHLRRWKLPSGSTNHYLWGPLFARAASDGRRLVLDGEGGDEVFGMQPMALVDVLLQGHPHRAQGLAGRVYALGSDGRRRRRRLQVLAQFTREGTAPHRIQRAVRRATGAGFPSPPMLDARRSRELRALFDPWRWKRGSGPLWSRRLIDSLTVERDALDVSGYLRRRAAGQGVTGRHPFLHDVELLETAASVDPEQLFDAYYDRPLLRAALDGRLPDALRLRQGKSHFSPVLYEAMTGGDLEILRAILLRPDAEVGAWLAGGWVRDELRNPRPDRHPRGRYAWAMDLFRAGAAECWLRTLADPEWPEREIPPGAPVLSYEISSRT